MPLILYLSFCDNVKRLCLTTNRSSGSVCALPHGLSLPEAIRCRRSTMEEAEEARHGSESSWSSEDDASNTITLLDFDVKKDPDTTEQDHPPRQAVRFRRVGVYSTGYDAIEAMETVSKWVYTYQTRDRTELMHVRVFACRSHLQCSHRIKIRSTHDEDDNAEITVEEGGEPTTTAIATRATRTRGIDRSLRAVSVTGLHGYDVTSLDT
jgi:hypothetical protein